MRLLALLCGVLVFASTGAAYAAPPPKAPAPPDPEWTQFRQNAGSNPRVAGGLQVSWRIRTNGGFSSSPTLHDGHVFIGNNIGQFFALNEKTGAVDWSRRFPSSLMANPIVYKNTLFLGVGNQMGFRSNNGSHAMLVGTGTSSLVAVDSHSGTQRWAFSLSGSGMPTPAIVNGLLIHHDGAGNVVGLDPQTGARRFVRDLGGNASMSAILPVGNDRFITTSYHKSAIWELKANNGATVWEHDFDEHASGISDCPPAADGARVFCDYIAPGFFLRDVNVGNPGQMHAYAVALADGKLVWDVPLETGTVPVSNEAAIPVVSGGMVFLGSSVAPFMHAIEATSGRLVWRTQVHGVVKGGVVTDADAVYFGDLSGYLWALGRSDGRVIGVKNMHTVFNVGSPVLDGRTLVIGTNKGEVLAVPVNEVRSSNDP